MRSSTSGAAARPALASSYAALAHLPGPPRSAFPLGYMYRALRDPLGVSQRSYDAFGPVFRRGNFGGWGVSLIGPEAIEIVLLNRGLTFSSEKGWESILGRIFPRGLVARDDPDHRLHRRALGIAFKPEQMHHYLTALNHDIACGLSSWADRIRFYPAVKTLTLDLAATSFLGVRFGAEADMVKRSFMAMVSSMTSILRYPIPGTAMWRAVRAREVLCGYFASEISKRRRGAGMDFFTQFCHARDEQGELLSDSDIIDHVSFLLAAAHDTLASSLTSTIYFLAKYPHWQDWAREEILSLGPQSCVEGPSHDELTKVARLEMCLKEAMRLHAPIPGIQRQAVRDVEIMGHLIPAGTQVVLNVMMTHRLPDIWPDPERFNPLRFTTEMIRKRHKYAWTPFGGGAHMCIGLHFANMQAKALLVQLLGQYRISLPEVDKTEFQLFPLPKPNNGLPVVLTPIR